MNIELSQEQLNFLVNMVQTTPVSMPAQAMPEYLKFTGAIIQQLTKTESEATHG
jgi:hypothetical protein